MESLKSILSASGIIQAKNRPKLQGGSMVKIKDFPKDYRKKEGKRRIECIKFLKRTVSKRYRDKTFLNFGKSRSPKAYEACRTYARNFLSNRDQGMGLFITGAVGSGKTHLVSAIIDYIARVHKQEVDDLIFITSVNLLSKIKFSFEDKTTEDLITDFEEADLLAIDDLGIEKSSDWTNEIFYKIIDSRYSNLMPTIITSNFTDAELKEKMSERIVSRIYEMCIGIRLTAKDYRTGG